MTAAVVSGCAPDIEAATLSQPGESTARMPDGQVILIAGARLAAALAASLLAGRIRVPGLVLFLGLGMAIGSDGTGWLEFGDYELARTIGIVALAVNVVEGV